MTTTTRRPYARRVVTSADVARTARVNHRAWRVGSATTTGTSYLVVRNPETGRLTCDCDGHFYHGTCYHTRTVLHFEAARAPRVEVAEASAQVEDAAVVARRAAGAALIRGTARVSA